MYLSVTQPHCVCVCLPAVNISAFDRGSLCRLPARLIHFKFFWQIMHRAGRMGPEPAIGIPDLDRSFFVGLVVLEVSLLVFGSFLSLMCETSFHLCDGVLVSKSTVARVMEASILGNIVELHINTVSEVLSHVPRLTLQPEPLL